MPSCQQESCGDHFLKYFGMARQGKWSPRLPTAKQRSNHYAIAIARKASDRKNKNVFEIKNSENKARKEDAVLTFVKFKSQSNR